jgi:hypothetical protein
MKKSYLTLFICILTLQTQSQSYKIPLTPILKHLYFSKNDINSISNTSQESYLPELNNKNKAYQKLVKTKSGLYITVDGTGKVFKATEIDKDFIRFDRIDTTIYFGNTFYSIDFANNDTLLSFGGYGFWHMNGQLRRFNSNKEWSVEKVSNIRHTINFIYNLNTKKQKLYYIEQPIHDEESNTKSDNYNAIEFDLISKTNKILGQVNSNLKLDINTMIDLPSLNGVLINSSRDILLLDFEHNKILKLINKSLIDALLDKSGSSLQNTFEEDGRIFYTNYPDTSLKSIPISINDFVDEPNGFYEQIDQNNYFPIGISIFLISIFTVIILYFKRKKDKISINKQEVIMMNDPYTNDFNVIEKTLIENLIEKCKSGSYFTVDDINTYLGTKKKPIEVQKSIRTEAINRINHKFNVNCKSDTSLIQRVRSKDDARFMNYIVSNENATLYNSYSKK